MELFRAVESADTARIRALLISGVDVNKRDPLDRTALTVASMLGLTEVVELLLEHGANPNLSDGMGQTALMCAARHDRQDAVALLLKAGADPAAANTTGQSVLWYATHREMHFTLPVLPGLHGTLFVRRLLRTRSKRLIDDAIALRT